jgi:O-antigen ligase
MLSPLRPAALRWACGLQFAFLNLALLLTYTRAQWIASVIALGLACLLMPAAGRRRLAPLVFAGLGPGILVAGLAVAGLLGARAGHGLDALLARASSLTTPGETLDSTSLQWRVFEIGEALESIARHPWLGVGLGNDYRPRPLLGGEARGDPRVTRFGGDTRLTRFMHNGYLYVATKAGLPTLAVLGWFAVALLVAGGRAYRAAPDAPPKALALAIVCGFAGFLEWTFFEPHLMLPASMATIGTMVAAVGAVDRPPPGPDGPGVDPT